MADLVDAQGRRVTYLRLSVNDVCNFRCTYCSPARYAGSAAWLSADEIARIVRVFASAGVRRVRLTGGEPTLRKDLVSVIATVRATPGIEEVALTTNATRVAHQAAALVGAGLGAVNVSLDTLDEQKLGALSGKSARLRDVIAGIDALVAAGARPIKTNTVVMGGVNDDELPAIVRFAWERGVLPRFIELMPFAGGTLVPEARMRVVLTAGGLRLDAAAATPIAGSGPARQVSAVDEATGRRGIIGFVTPITGNFCDGCNRVRVGASGRLRACLGGADEVDLAALVRAGASDGAILDAIRGALAAKKPRHDMNGGARGRRLLPMMGMGG